MSERAQVLMAVTCPREICAFGTVHLPPVPIEALVVVILFFVSWKLLFTRQRPPLVALAPDPSTQPSDEARLLPEPAYNVPAPVCDMQAPANELQSRTPVHTLRRRSAPPMPPRRAAAQTTTPSATVNSAPLAPSVHAAIPPNNVQAQTTALNLRRRSAPPMPPAVTADSCPPLPAQFAARQNPALTPSTNCALAVGEDFPNCEPRRKVKTETCVAPCKENRAPDTAPPHHSAIAEPMVVDSPDFDGAEVQLSAQKSDGKRKRKLYKQPSPRNLRLSGNQPRASSLQQDKVSPTSLNVEPGASKKLKRQSGVSTVSNSQQRAHPTVVVID